MGSRDCYAHESLSVDAGEVDRTKSSDDDCWLESGRQAAYRSGRRSSVPRLHLARISIMRA